MVLQKRIIPAALSMAADLANVLNTLPKYVASATLAEPLAWQNSVLLRGDTVTAVRALKQQDGAALHVIGSAKLAETLLDNDLVDNLRLMIDPVVVGGGKRIFRDDGVLRRFELLGSQVAASGAMVVTYAVCPA